MSRSKAAAAAALASLLSACGPHGAHVDIADCKVDASGGIATLHARMRNDSDKPVGRIDVRTDSYNDFRFVRLAFSPSFVPVLDPGTSRDVVDHAPYDGELHASGPQCTATAVTYGDGTTGAVP